MADIFDVYAAHERQIDAIRARTVLYVGRAWDALDTWRGSDIAEFVASITSVVEGAQQATAAATAAELASVESMRLGTARTVAGIPRAVATTTSLRGITTHEMFARTGPEVWSQLSRGVPIEGAVRAGRIRAQTMTATNLELAKTHAAQHVMASDTRVVGHRRVLKGRSCPLCTTAASQRYHKAKLLPIHDRCDCGVEPIYGDVDPGQVIDVKTVPGDEEAEEAEEVDVVVHEHGELGPVLTVKGQHFTGPEDIP